MAVSERVDARRNRERLVAAARTLLARDGADVPAREIARETGVGVATLYRHFPTRDDLIDAVLEDTFTEILAAAERGLAAGDPWAGFTGFIDETLALTAHNRVLTQVLQNDERGRERAAAMRSRLRPLTENLVRRAQDAGALRRDFTADDLALVFWATDRVIDLAPDAWRRHLGYVVDGLRA